MLHHFQEDWYDNFTRLTNILRISIINTALKNWEKRPCVMLLYCAATAPTN